MSYILCDNCGEFGIELIGDTELGCEYCLRHNEVDSDYLYEQMRDDRDMKGGDQ